MLLSLKGPLGKMYDITLDNLLLQQRSNKMGAVRRLPKLALLTGKHAVPANMKRDEENVMSVIIY